MLKPEERTKFTKMMGDPTSELAQRLLGSQELESQLIYPWWEKPDSISTHESKRYGDRPKLMAIPEAMIKGAPTGHPLLFNVAALWCVISSRSSSR